MVGTIRGSDISCRYYEQDFDFPARTGTGTGGLRMSGRNLVLRTSHWAWRGDIEAIPGAEAGKPWVTIVLGREALARCTSVMQ